MAVTRGCSENCHEKSDTDRHSDSWTDKGKTVYLPSTELRYQNPQYS